MEPADEVPALPGPSANVQEGQLVAVHVLCKAVEAALPAVDRRAS